METSGAGSSSVVVIGGGAAGLSCATHLAALDSTARVTLVDADPDQPYDRPPLSKDVLSGRVSAEDLGRRLRKQLDDHGIELVHDAVGSVDPSNRTVLTRDNGPISYGSLVLAPGCAPINPWQTGNPGVQTMHSLRDVAVLQARLSAGARVVLIGAGLIGLEVASVLRGLEHPVTVLEAENQPMQRILGAEVAARVARAHQEKGVGLVLGQRVADVAARGEGYEVFLDDGGGVRGDAVVSAIGVRPATSWLKDTPILLGSRGEIVADEVLRTSVGGVWAAGDAVSWPSGLLGGRRRVEHWACAKEQGRYVAEAIADNAEPAMAPFDTIPYFWSMQYGRMLQAAGSFDADTILVDDSSTVTGGFTARYVKGSSLIGVVSSGDPRAFLAMRTELDDALHSSGMAASP